MVLVLHSRSETEHRCAPMTSQDESSKESGSEHEIILKTISTRYEGGEFPIVLSSEQKGLEVNEADEILAAARDIEPVQIKAFIDGKYTEFCNKNSDRNGVSDDIHLAMYLLTSYFSNLGELLALEFPRSELFDTLSEDYGLEKLEKKREGRLRKILCVIDVTKHANFVEYVRAKWQKKWKARPEYWREARYEKAEKHTWFGQYIEDTIASWESDSNVEDEPVGIKILRKALEDWIDIFVLGADGVNDVANMIEDCGIVKADILKEYVESTWKKEWEQYEDEDDMDEEETKKLWFKAKGMDALTALLKGTVSKTESYVYKPDIELNQLDSSVAAAIEDKIPSITEIQSHHIQDLWKQKFASKYRKIHKDIIRDNYAHLFSSFMNEHYLSIIVEVQSSTPNEETAYTFKPAISVEELLEKPGNEEAEKIFAAVELEHEKPIRDKTAEGYAEMCEVFDPVWVASMKDSLYKQFLLSGYLNIVREVVTNPSQTVEVTNTSVTPKSSSIRSKMPRSNTTIDADNFCSPRKRPKVETAQSVVSNGNPPEMLSVAELYGRIGAEPGTTSVEVRFLYCDSEVRHADLSNATNRTKPKKKNQAAVLTLVVSDRTGCIYVELWREAASNICELAQEWNEEDSNVLLRISNYTVVEDKRTMISKSCKLIGDDRTQVARISFSTRPSLVDPTTHLAGSIFIRNISLLAAKPPFFVHLAGIVSMVQDLKVSRQGNEMRDFRLSDISGNYVECRALGRHVHNPHIADKNEVVIYGSSVTVPQGNNKSGYLWLFNEAHVVILKRKCVVPKSLRHIEFEEEE